MIGIARHKIPIKGVKISINNSAPNFKDKTYKC